MLQFNICGHVRFSQMICVENMGLCLDSPGYWIVECVAWRKAVVCDKLWGEGVVVLVEISKK